MSRTQETEQLAATTFFEILGEGKPPTVDLIVAWLAKNGHGNRYRNTISKAIKDCWEIVGQRNKIATNIPGISEDTVALVVALRDSLLRDVKVDFEEDLAKARTDFDDLAVQERAKTAEATDAATLARRDQSTAEALVSELRAELVRLTERFDNAGRELQRAHEDHAQLTSSVAALGEQNKALERELTVTAATHERSLTSEQERFNTMQHSLQRELDEARTTSSRHQKELQKLTGQIEQLRSEQREQVRQAADEHSRLSAELGKAQGAAELLQQQLVTVQVAADAKQIAFAELQYVCNGHVAALADAKTQIEDLQAAISMRMPVTREQLQELLTQAHLSGLAFAKDSKQKAGAKVSKEAAEAYAADLMQKHSL